MNVQNCINTSYMLVDDIDRHINMICACCDDGCCKHCDKLDIVEPNAHITETIHISNREMDKILTRRNMVTAYCEYEHVSNVHDSDDFVLVYDVHDFKISHS